MTDLVTLEARLQADANAILDRNLSSRPYVIFDSCRSSRLIALEVFADRAAVRSTVVGP
jgi:hypothetical protein